METLDPDQLLAYEEERDWMTAEERRLNDDGRRWSLSEVREMFGEEDI
jgi:hypothetical protein